MGRKQGSVHTGLPCFASGTLICLNPGLICNFVQGTAKQVKKLVINTNICSELCSVGVVSTQRGQVKSRLPPGGPSVQRANQQELYIPYLQTFNFFQVSSYQVHYSRQLDPRTELSNFILLRSLTSSLKVKTSTSS